jgi:hypothetical protein
MEEGPINHWKFKYGPTPLKDENKVLPDFDCRCLNVLSDIEVCEQDVIDIISTLKVDSAVGHDIISTRMLLAVKGEIAPNIQFHTHPLETS